MERCGEWHANSADRERYVDGQFKCLVDVLEFAVGSPLEGDFHSADTGHLDRSGIQVAFADVEIEREARVVEYKLRGRDELHPVLVERLFHSQAVAHTRQEVHLLDRNVGRHAAATAARSCPVRRQVRSGHDSNVCVITVGPHRRPQVLRPRLRRAGLFWRIQIGERTRIVGRHVGDHRVRIKRAVVGDMCFLDDVRELHRTERNRQAVPSALCGQHASNNPAGCEQNLVALNIRGARCAGVDRPHEPVGTLRADRLSSVLHDDDAVLIRHLAVAGRRHAVTDLGLGQGRSCGGPRCRITAAVSGAGCEQGQKAHQHGGSNGHDASCKGGS